MSTKANNSPVVKSMRALGEERGWKASIIVALKDDGTFEAASWGSTVKRCNALALVLNSIEVADLAGDMRDALDLRGVS